MTETQIVPPLEFDGFQIMSIEDRGSLDHFGWIEVGVWFKDPRTNAYPEIKCRLPVLYERSWTVEKVREAAFVEFRRLLGAAAQLLESHNLGELQKGVDDARKAHDEKIQRMKSLD